MLNGGERSCLDFATLEGCHVLENVYINVDANYGDQKVELDGFDKLPPSCKSVVLIPGCPTLGLGQFYMQLALGWQIRQLREPLVIYGALRENAVELFRV